MVGRFIRRSAKIDCPHEARQLDTTHTALHYIFNSSSSRVKTVVLTVRVERTGRNILPLSKDKITTAALDWRKDWTRHIKSQVKTNLAQHQNRPVGHLVSRVSRIRLTHDRRRRRHRQEQWAIFFQRFLDFCRIRRSKIKISKWRGRRGGGAQASWGEMTSCYVIQIFLRLMFHK